MMNGLRRNEVWGRRRGGGRLLAVSLALILSFPGTAFGAGWEKQSGGGWRYQREDGSYLCDGFSHDGYYVDDSGIWREETEILGAKVANGNTFLTPSQAGSMVTFEKELKPMMERIGKDCGNVRSITLEEKRITYFALEDNKERELFSFYKDGETYVLRLKSHLSDTRGSKARSSWYDYQILSAILLKVSPAGMKLAEAVYSSWEDDNQYGVKNGGWVLVGDAWMTYEGESGAGMYRITNQQEAVFVSAQGGER